MKAAIVTGPGKTPVYGDFPEPVAGPDEELITVTASALSHLTKSRAAGSHYSSSGAYPAVPGVDGVGRTSDGRRVYFAMPAPPSGAMAAKAVVRKSQCLELPVGLDDVTAAAMANPGMSSAAAFRERAHLLPGETVLINGATGIAGNLAVQIAKQMGAGKIIATGRNAAALIELKSLGANETISLTLPDSDLESAFGNAFAAGVDVVIDYLWGKSAESILIAAAKSGKEGVPIRFVQIGTVSAENISLPGAALRSSALVLMGSGLRSVSLPNLLSAIDSVFQAAVKAKFRIETEAVPLADIEQTWDRPTGNKRLVFVI